MSHWRRWFRPRSDAVRHVNDTDSFQTTFQWTYDPAPQGMAGDSAEERSAGRHAGEVESDERAASEASEPVETHGRLELSVQDDQAHVAPRHMLRADGYAKSMTGSAIVRRAPEEAYLLRRLDEALAAWRSGREFPSSALLRVALEALEAGQDLPPELRTLLLHTALYRRRGVLTALRHQDDPERVGLVVAEALTTVGAQTPIELVRAMAERDPTASAWRRTLLAELRAVTAGPDRGRAVLASRAYDALASSGATEPATVRDALAGEGQAKRGKSRLALRPILWLAVLACAIGLGVVAVAFRSQSAGMVEVRAGEYALPGDGASGTLRSVSVERFSIERFETTNREYRRCYERGECDWPSDSHLEADGFRIENYFVDPAYDMYPVVNVSLNAAETYCRWAGKRLPAEAEWLVAAFAAPATGRFYTYPWGEQFGSSRANTLESGRGAPTAIGSFSPAGDSPSGAADMAGNVAEWTSSLSEDGASAAVMGGSYRDGSDAARANTSLFVPIKEPSGWIGFRCARD